MKTSKLHVVSALLGLFVLRTTVAAQDIYPVPTVPNSLATRSFFWDQLAGTTSFQIYLGINHGLYTDTLLFDSYTFTSADAGKTFVITQAQDPDFNALVGQLTDGNSDWIACELWINGGVIGQAQEERNFFAPLPPGNNGTDLGGFPIDNIALRIDQAGRKRLESIQRGMEDALKACDLVMASDWDLQFHLCLAELSGNPGLIDTVLGRYADVLGKLTDIYAMSGHEQPMREAILSLVPAWARTSIVTDSAGNLVLAMGPNRDTSVIVAHMDEIGFEVTGIAKDGTLTLRPHGSFFPYLWEGQPALLHPPIEDP